jgi:hypothetical protein
MGWEIMDFPKVLGKLGIEIIWVYVGTGALARSGAELRSV